MSDSLDLPIHPSMNGAEVLDVVLRSMGWTQKRLSDAMGVSQKHVSAVMNGHSNMGPKFAAQAELALELPELAETLLVAQARGDAELAVRVERAEWYGQHGPGRLRTPEETAALAEEMEDFTVSESERVPVPEGVVEGVVGSPGGDHEA